MASASEQTAGELQVAPAQAGDADAVIGLWRAAELTRPWNDPATDFTQALQGPTSTVLLARDGEGEPVATAMLGVDGHRGWIYYFATSPGSRGRGYGAVLLAASERWLAEHGARKVQLMVRDGNPAASFYTARGYTDQETTVYGRWL